MLLRKLFLLTCISFIALALPACSRLSGANNLPATLPATLVPLPTATAVPVEPTSASIPTATPPQATAVPANPTGSPVSPTAPPVVVVITATPPPPTPHGDGACTYQAAFLGDVTIPDNTVVPAGTPFVKTWRVQNTGTCTWGTAGFGLHSLVFVGGVQLSASSPVPLPVAQVPPGSAVDISVPMVAPSVQGTFRSEWMLQVDNGPRVGFGPGGSTPLYAQIISGPPSTGSGATRITFAPGATEASVQGALSPGQSQDFIINAAQGQTMMLDLSSTSSDAGVTVSGAHAINPQVIRSSGTGWLGVLPATEDYIIRVSAGSAAANFSMNVTIPQRIVFAPGAIAATVAGTTAARRTVTYLLRASAGQTMAATLTAPPGTVALTIYGLTDGEPLVRAVMGQMSWTGQLPGTQDYVIEAVPAVDGTVNFSLHVVVQ